MNYYIYCWYNQNEAVQNSNIQKQRITEWYWQERLLALESLYLQLRKYTNDKRIRNIENKSNEYIKQ